MKQVFAYSLALIAAALALASCSPVESATDVATPAPQLMVAGGEIDNLMPPKYARGEASALYSCLLDTGPDGIAVPDLAVAIPSQANGMISKDGLTINYHLRKDARWEDGTPVTADDIIFTEHAILSPDNSYPFTVGYSSVRSITAPDPHTVRVRMKNVYSPILHKLFAQNFCFGILPKHVFHDYNHLSNFAADARPVVSGPFKVADWQRGDRLELDPNPLYFRGAPHIRLVDRFVKNDNTAISMMKTGELDAVFGATPVVAVNLRNEPGLTERLSNSPNVAELIINCSDPLLKDVRMRHALAYALDRDTIAKNVSFGYYEPAQVEPSIFGWAYDPSVHQLAFNLQKANALLDSMGWARGSNGMRSRNGVPLQLTLVSATEGDNPNVDVQIQGQLARVGIGVDIKPTDPAIIFSDITVHAKFQLFYVSWSFQGWDSDLSPLLACDEAPPAGGNYGRFCDPRFDAVNTAAYSTYDEAARRKYYAVAQRLFYEDTPQILLWSSPVIDVYTKRLKNFDSVAGQTYYHVSDWRLDPR
jgi:peptide/nickel transport system substrate-binding protein